MMAYRKYTACNGHLCAQAVGQKIQHRPYLGFICRPAAKQKVAGVTLIELVVVIVIIGIIGAVVLSRNLQNPSDLIAWHEKIKAHLRYAQGRSMHSRQFWGIKFTKLDSDQVRGYYLFPVDENSTQSIDVAMAVRLPGEERTDNLVELPDKLNFGLADELIFTFDHWGRPYAGFALLSNDRQFSVSQGSDPETITVTANTGFVP